MCPCKVCKYSIDGGLDCKENLEKECREGGGYESFEPKWDEWKIKTNKIAFGNTIVPYILGGAAVILVRLIVTALIGG